MSDSTNTAPRKLHPDWPDLDPRLRRYEMPAPLYDLDTAMSQGLGEGVESVDSIVRYSVSYYGGADWKPGDDGGTELNMAIVGRLNDGRWFAVEAWNDYTGWGCQDSADVLAGATEEYVVYQGLGVDARKRLGYTERA